MKIRFYSGFDSRLRQLIEEVAEERGHTVRHLPGQPALVTFMNGYGPRRLTDLYIQRQVLVALKGGGFVVVVNPARESETVFKDSGAYDILRLESKLFDHELKVGIDAYIAELEQAMARIT